MKEYNRWKAQSFRFSPEVTELLELTAKKTFQSKTDVLVQGLRIIAIKEGISIQPKGDETK